MEQRPTMLARATNSKRPAPSVTGSANATCMKKNRIDYGMRMAGSFVLGTRLESSRLNRNIVHCLARKVDTDRFYTMKMVTTPDAKDMSDGQRQARMLLHNEYSLLSLLQHQKGVVRQHGLFKDKVVYPRGDEVTAGEGLSFRQRSTTATRVGLVLDCLVAHDFSSSSRNHVNLLEYVIAERGLREQEAVAVFFVIVQIVAELHEKNVIHRNLTPVNMVLNKATRDVILTNFCLSKQLLKETDPLQDQVCALAYISPEVLYGKPYLGKPCDVWALGILFYTMLYGNYPIFDCDTEAMKRKIMTASFDAPKNGLASVGALSIIQNLLLLDPLKRMTAAQALSALQRIASGWHSLRSIEAFQVVPCDINQSSEQKEGKGNSGGCGGSVTSTCTGASEFELKLRDLNDKAALRLAPRTLSLTTIASGSRALPAVAVRRVNQDARPLTAAERFVHRHLLQQTSTGGASSFANATFESRC